MSDLRFQFEPAMMRDVVEKLLEVGVSTTDLMTVLRRIEVDFAKMFI